MGKVISTVKKDKSNMLMKSFDWNPQIQEEDIMKDEECS